jgi:hypothetical protein
MSSISELVEMLKDGSISKDQMLEMLYSSSFPSKPVEKSQRFEKFEKTADRETEVEFNTTEFEDFNLRPTPMFDPSFSVVNSDTFFDRQVQWDTKRSLNQELLREQKLKVEDKECTFKPKTNSQTSPLFTQETFERLAKCRENLRVIKQREDQERKKLEDELLPCTFHPQINRNSCISGSKYLNDTPKRSFKPEEPSFAPRVKGPGKDMKNAKEYIKQDPFERLSRPKELKQPEPEDDSPKSQKPSTPCLEHSGCSFSTKPFFERQALYELMKLEKKEILESQPLAKPAINERSKKLVKKAFFERNQEMIEKKSNPKPDPHPCSFQPKITNLAKMRRNRSFNEMSYGDSKKRLEKVEALKEAAEEKARELTVPCSVQSRSYSNVKSKLQILEDPQSYIERVKSEQRKKEIVSQIMQDERAKNELKDCTYQPCIIDAPDYVKQIARNMAMIKAERVSYFNKAAKPEWR